jgi:protein required for attachment to host cells
MTEHDAGVMVGDGQKSRFFRSENDSTDPNLETLDVRGWERPCTSDQDFDRPGRMHASIGTAPGAMQETNWRKLVGHRFAGDIADALYSAAHGDRCDKLMIAPSPTIMGNLRKGMHMEASDKMMTEVSPGHTNMRHGEIEKIPAGHTCKGATQ